MNGAVSRVPPAVLRDGNCHEVTGMSPSGVAGERSSDLSLSRRTPSNKAMWVVKELHAYQNHKLLNLAKALEQVAATRRAMLPWIPAYCGISGKE